MANATEVTSSPVEISELQRRRGLVLIALATAGVSCAMSIQGGLNPNFLVDVIGVDGGRMGLIEAVRETSGIMAFGFLALLAGFAEPLVAAAMLVVVGVALGAYSKAPTFAWVLGLSVIWSQGLHIWMPLQPSMTLALAEPGKTGLRLGQIGAAGAVGSALGLGVALLLSHCGVPIRTLYFFAGATPLVSAAACLGIPRKIKTPGPKLVFSRRYKLFYILQFLEGWRKQVFMCFAGFYLVKVHHTEVTTTLLLLACSQALGYFLSPRVGRLIDRLGERRMLTFYYSCMMLLFLGYTFVNYRPVLWGLFMMDNAFFVFTPALSTYVGKIAPKSEHTATLSMGVAMNHVAAVTMPIVGGVLWVTLGYRWTFFIGIIAAAGSLLAVSRLPKFVAKREPVASGESVGSRIDKELCRGEREKVAD